MYQLVRLKMLVGYVVVPGKCTTYFSRYLYFYCALIDSLSCKMTGPLSEVSARLRPKGPVLGRLPHAKESQGSELEGLFSTINIHSKVHRASPLTTVKPRFSNSSKAGSGANACSSRYDIDIY